MSDSKNDIAWAKLFAKYNIADRISIDGHFVISATQINEFREARLMTKFDHESQLPRLFTEHNISILPISRGDYIVGKMNAFCEFDKTNDIEIYKIDFPNILESLDYKNITSETTAINCAFVTGILSDFTNEEYLYPTVSGRMSSSIFSFSINSLKGQFNINVENSQLEIDGGYEGEKSLNLIEAKNYISDDFLIRQLYYPYRLWDNKITKTVKPIFLTYSNGIFHLREYSFNDKAHYNSITLVRQKKYTIREGAINVETIQQLLSETNTIPEPTIPFPQADSFERVINLCELLKQRNILTKDDITNNYDFDERQTNYYTDAARYLGLVVKILDEHQVSFRLTDIGNTVFELPISDRQLRFTKQILEHDIFSKVLQLYFEKGEMPSRDEIIEIMKGSNLYKVSSYSTYYRRASTIISWIKWIINLIEE